MGRTRHICADMQATMPASNRRVSIAKNIFNVLIDSVQVALRDKLRKQPPMARGGVGAGRRPSTRR